MLARHAFRAFLALVVATAVATSASADTDLPPTADTAFTEGDGEDAVPAPEPAEPVSRAEAEAPAVVPARPAATAKPAAVRRGAAAAGETAKKTPAKPVLVPGTGSLVKGGGDDFEDPNWQWYYNHPKSSEEMDKKTRAPMGRSRDGSWFEGPKRGTPDVVKRIELPAPGLEGSAHGMLFSTRQAGIPNRLTGQMQQDDLVFNLTRATGGQGITVADSPSVVVRVYLPPFEQWEKRTGPSFGFRAGCYTHATITADDHPREGKWGLEEYWPGMFICFESGQDGRHKQDAAYLRIRGGRNGGEIMGPRITELGWWTLGLSFSPDGMVHYFASPGVDPLTMDDHITSQFPYGYRTEWFKTYFFNVCARDDGKTWSTPWVVDDPKVYFVRRSEMATTPSRKR
ncbi:MAG: hypothetical protein ACKOSQ_04980 [Planctomycetaceae bacterium]